MKEKNYYVYELIDPITNLPFYVGKGTKNRMYMHEKKAKNNKIGNNVQLYKVIKNILNNGNQVRYNIIEDNLFESDAYKLEIEIISGYGRRCNSDGGLLVNLSRGGKGCGIDNHTGDTKQLIKENTKKAILEKYGVSNIMELEEFRKKVSKGLMGHKAWNKGCHRSEKTKQKIKDTIELNGNHFKGKTHSDELKQKWSNERVGCGNINFTKFIVSDDIGNKYTFYGAKEMDNHFNKINLDLELRGPNRISSGRIRSIGRSKNYILLEKIKKY